MKRAAFSFLGDCLHSVWAGVRPVLGMRSVVGLRSVVDVRRVASVGSETGVRPVDGVWRGGCVGAGVRAALAALVLVSVGFGNAGAATLFVPDLELTDTTLSAVPVVHGTIATFSFVVKNVGTSTESAAVFTNNIPYGTFIVSTSCSQGQQYYSNGSVVTQLGALGVGESATVRLNFGTSTFGYTYLTASVAGSGGETNLVNNTVFSGVYVVSGSGSVSPSTVGHVRGDFDRDGHPDLVIDSKFVDVLRMGSNYMALGGGPAIAPSAGFVVVAAGDLNGDGITDILTQKGRELAPFLMTNFSTAITCFSKKLAGLPGVLPLGETVFGIEDYNHDGKGDLFTADRKFGIHVYLGPDFRQPGVLLGPPTLPNVNGNGAGVTRGRGPGTGSTVSNLKPVAVGGFGPMYPLSVVFGAPSGGIEVYSLVGTNLTRTITHATKGYKPVAVGAFTAPFEDLIFQKGNKLFYLSDPEGVSVICPIAGLTINGKVVGPK